MTISCFEMSIICILALLYHNPDFLKLSYPSESLQGFVKVRLQGTTFRVSDAVSLEWRQEFAFLNSQVILMLLVEEPHFGNNCHNLNRQQILKYHQ